MNNYQIFRKIQERDNIIKKYSNDTKEDLIDLVIEKDNIIDNLQSKIDKANRILNANTHVENIYHALCNLFDEEYQYEINNEELNKILKEDK